MNGGVIDELPFASEPAMVDQFLLDMKAALGFAGLPGVEAVKVIRKPYSRVYRVTLSYAEERKTVYIKERRITPERAERVRNKLGAEYRVTSELSIDGHCGYGVVVPLAAYPSVPALVTLGADGPTLSEVYSSGLRLPGRLAGKRARHLEESVVRCGRWLHDFHVSTARGHLPFDVQDLMGYIEPRLERLVSRDSEAFPRSLAEQFREGLKERARGIAADSNLVAGRHNDFASHNIVCPADGVRILDFGMFDYGSIAYDACRFWLELEFLKSDPLLSTRRIAVLQRLFIDSYGLIDPSSPAFEVAQSRVILNTLLNAVTRTRMGWFESHYRRRLVRICRKWMQDTAGST